MSVITYNFTKLLRQGVTKRVLSALVNHSMPWQKPWEGHGYGVGFPREVRTKKKFFGVNFLLLQMAGKERGFTSSWWGTIEQFIRIGSTVKSRPEQVIPGDWGTGIVVYNPKPVFEIVYNLAQLTTIPKSHCPKSTLMPTYDLAEKVLHATGAKIESNMRQEAWYFYPPKDYITLPTKRAFEMGFGGLPGYYESLAHELMHWTEPRVGFDTESDEAIRELRADVGAAMLMEELAVPHSISFTNFEKWRERWIDLLEKDFNLIFKVCAAASKAVDYITSFSKNIEGRFNQIDESLV